MNLRGILIATHALCALGFLSAEAEPTEQQTCEVSKGTQRNGALAAFVPHDGKLVFRPGGGGFVDRDGALGTKFGWARPAGSLLIVGGRRLDGDAPPARAYMNDGYRTADGQPSYLVFPTPGCWEITGRVGDQSLTFVVQVEKEGDGPSWKYDGLPPGGFWYQTTLESGRTHG